MIALFLLAAVAPVPEPVLDGNCDDHLVVAPIELEQGVLLYIRETRDHLWLCATLPSGSFGIGDLTISTTAVPDQLNLHASAQLGEWATAKPDTAPKDGASDLWWNNRGWSANTSRFNGIDKPTGAVRFRPILSREYQLSKARFGKGNWQFALTLSEVATPAGDRVTLRYPAEGVTTRKVR